MKLPEHLVLAVGCSAGKLLRAFLPASAFLLLSSPLPGQTGVHVPVAAGQVPIIRPSVNPVRVVPHVAINNRPAVSPPVATTKVQVPRLSLNSAKINLGPSSYYAGYPYGYVPYNTRFFYPPYNGNSISSTAGQTGVGKSVAAPLAGTESASGSLLGKTPRHNFQYDDSEVLAVQTALRRLGYYTGSLDGILGPDTQAAIENYQAAKKQPVTGFIDRATLSTLGIVTSAPH